MSGPTLGADQGHKPDCAQILLPKQAIAKRRSNEVLIVRRAFDRHHQAPALGQAWTSAATDLDVAALQALLDQAGVVRRT